MRQTCKIVKSFLIICAFLPMLVFAANEKDANNFSLQQYGMTVDQVKQSAAQGNADAEYALGYMYYYGKGLPRDEESARMWIGKAAAQGQPQATQALQLLKKPGEGQAVVKQAAVTDAANNQVNPNNSPQQNAVVAQASNAELANNATTPSATLAVSNDAGAANADSAGATPAPTTASASTNDNATTAVVDVAPAKAKTKSLSPSSSKTSTVSTSTKTGLTIQKIVHAPGHYYTVQLLGSFNKKDAVDFINRNNLQHKAIYYRASFESKPWFVVVYGLYPTEGEAKLALKRLAPQLDRAKPWVKSIAAVHESMK